MNLSEYKKLCTMCDEILLSKESSVYTKAIPWLHVLNEHPTTLKRYTSINKINKEGFVFVIKVFLQCIINFLKGPFFKPWVFSSPELQQKDVLIISHLLNQEQLGSKDDFYFGALPSELIKQDKSALILLLNHPNVNINNFIGKWDTRECPRIIFSNKLSFFIECKLFFKAIKEFFLIKNRAKRLSESYELEVNKAASRAAFSFETISSIRFMYQLTNLIRVIKPKIILTTIEGHCFERIAFYCARKIVPKVRCIGYQHAILFPRHHSIKRPLYDNFDPDIILTAGLHSQDILKKGYEASKNIKIKCIGTHRRKELVLKKAADSKKRKNPCCLILPDGNLIECLRMCKFTNGLARTLPQTRFIIRLHPLMNLNYLKRKSKIFVNMPENISFSEHENIDDDFSLALWALYRGSGSAIHAAIAGLRPIYVAIKQEMSIDPLFKINTGRQLIYSKNEIAKIFNEDLSSSKEAIESELRELKNFSEQYYKPVDMIALMNELDVKN